MKNDLEYLSNTFDEHVIFTRTNLKGIITHASKAFCEISGYSFSELIDSPHNIVRHPDTKKEIFEDMWASLAKYGKWSGEIKNLNKDGGFYWILAKVEVEYDSNNKRIGYHAIRHDITAQKEVEELKKDLENINAHLEDQVNEKIIEVIKLNKDIKDTQKEIIFTMGTIGESRSKETGFHVKRVAEYSKLLALHAGIHEYEADMIKQASPMHDIGKIGIPDAILNKPGRLTDEDRVVMNTHATLGFEMLNHSDKELLRMSAIVAHEHHEKWDGSGYPRGLKGEDIHIYGGITAIADVFDALGSDRAYKKAWDDESIWKLLRDESAKHFDPTLREIFCNHIDDFLEIRDRFKENIISET